MRKRRNQAWQAPLRQLVISLSHGAEWKALISTYIGTMPLSGDALAIEHNASGDPPPSTPVSSAMIAKVGAAARYRKSAPAIARRIAVFTVERTEAALTGMSFAHV